MYYEREVKSEINIALNSYFLQVNVSYWFFIARTLKKLQSFYPKAVLLVFYVQDIVS